MEFVPLDAGTAEERYRLEPIDDLTPEMVFDARWAMALLSEAKARLGQEFAALGKASTFKILKPYLDIENRQEPPSYEQAAASLRIDLGAVKPRFTGCGSSTLS